MTFRVRVLERAEADVRSIYEWLLSRSPEGANRWYDAFEADVERLVPLPRMWPIAPEDEYVNYEVRHCPFRTRRGKPYRLLFTIIGDEVRILHVRGHGQAEVNELGLPEDG